MADSAAKARTAFHRIYARSFLDSNCEWRITSIAPLTSAPNT